MRSLNIMQVLNYTFTYLPKYADSKRKAVYFLNVRQHVSISANDSIKYPAAFWFLVVQHVVRTFRKMKKERSRSNYHGYNYYV